MWGNLFSEGAAAKQTHACHHCARLGGLRDTAHERSLVFLLGQVSGEQPFADVARGVLRYVSRDLSDKVSDLESPRLVPPRHLAAPALLTPQSAHSSGTETPELGQRGQLVAPPVGHLLWNIVVSQ